MRRRDFAASLAFAGWGLPAFSQPSSSDEAARLHALFDRQWEDEARRFPEWSTWKGDHRFNDSLGDESKAAWNDFDAHVLKVLDEARAIRRDRLGAADRVSLDLFIHNLQQHAERMAFPGYRTLLVGANGGLQSEFADLMHAVPMRSVPDAQNLLKRFAAFGRQLGQNMDHLRRGMSMGWVSSRPVLERALKQIDEQLAQPVDESAYFTPFRRISADVPQADQDRLRVEARTAIAQHVLPAMRELRAFLAGDYLRKAPASGAMSVYPDGARVYELLARQRTTTPLPAAEIHRIGLRELARIRAEMETTMREAKFQGSFAEFVRYINTDPKFFHASADSLLAGYRDIAKRIDAEMPRLFAELPRAPYGVRAMPAFKGPGAAEYYDGPALDGSRGGWFNANVLALKSRPTWMMATLTAHEAMPGHHLQIARAIELRNLPKFRRASGYNAFGEGWAVYAETLGREIGLYGDPYSLFGHLQWQALRAARLVVDTGIHAQGWTRERSIEYMVDQTGMHRDFISQEVDRYTSWPGQALGYMIGKLKFDELRARARTRLGPKFDVRRFHNAVLDNGSLPLDVLDRLLDEWIVAEAAR